MRDKMGEVRSDKSNHQQISDRKIPLISSISFGVFIGAISGFGAVYDEQKSFTEGFFTAIGFLVFGFVLAYFRFARCIAEFLAAIP